MALLALWLASLGVMGARAGAPGTFVIVGNSGASAQQMFLTSETSVQIVDKTERNGNASFVVNGHVAWAAEYNLLTNQATPRDIVTNSFCAGGGVLANGTWVDVGGNNAVGLAGATVTTGTGPYDDLTGGNVVRMLDTAVCDPNSATYCSNDWYEWDGMPTNRWYPTLETLADGSLMVIGGELYGGYVDQTFQNVPTYEFIPSNGPPVNMQFLVDTQPLQLFPLTWLLPSGMLLMQAGNSAQLWDVVNVVGTPLPNIPGGQRVYPASAGSTSLPMTPENGYNLTAIFCGGVNQNLATDYNPPTVNVSAFVGITDCQTITPDVSQEWVATDDLIQGTVMLNLINLPDGRLFGLNGCAMGTAGYGWTDWGNGQGYGRTPRLMPAGYYNHSAPLGQRWSQAGVQASTIPRMYHSSATLLPDGTIMVAGSNPSADFIGYTSTGVDVNATDPYHTEYRVEIFYPDYIGKPRPVPSNLPTTISYGGPHVDITLPANNITRQADLDNTKVVLMRTGFSTHSTNFGQRHVELPTSYTWNTDGSATIHVGQLPPNANVLAPGPCLFFVVMNGVPSIAKFVTVGNGVVGTQPTSAAVPLPSNSVPFLQTSSSNAAAGPTSSGGAGHGGSGTNAGQIGLIAGIAAAGVLLLALLLAALLCVRRRNRNRSRAQPASRGSYRPAALDTSQIAYPTLPYAGDASRASSQQDLLGKDGWSRQSSNWSLYSPKMGASEQDLLHSPSPTRQNRALPGLR